ncbi:MAG: hypothetical protein HFH53_05730 [Hespellia sp.]|nr:hypothetical protein [Hespellia sp.]
MDDGRKKLRICLTAVVFLAVAAGVFYYCWYGNQSGTTVSEGTLIAIDGVRSWL